MDADIVFENNVARWVMNKMDGEMGGTYSGTFAFRPFLNPIQQLQAGREFRELLGSLGNQASESEVNLAFALSQLKQRIISAPPFWTSTKQESGIEGNVGDLNVIAAVLDAAIRAENVFKTRVEEERQRDLDRSIEVAERLLDKRNKGE